MNLFDIKPIGGYFELELAQCKEHHYKNVIRLNSGRNCLEYILLAKKYKKIYIPYYICDAVLEVILRLKIPYDYYFITDNFTPKDITLHMREVLLWVNFFGILDSEVKKIVKSFKSVIVDNTQAFYSSPIKEIDTFYSPRKFFGVPDGGYLYINKPLSKKIPTDVSFNNIDHLIRRIDIGPNNGYSSYMKNEQAVGEKKLAYMSPLTQKILQSIDYEKALDTRNKNFAFLHYKLMKYNEITFNMRYINGPMVYPFFYKKEGLREFLIKNDIYVATYWKEILEKAVLKASFEYDLVRYLMPLPIDQRYRKDDMNKIYKLIIYFIKYYQ